MKNIRVISLFLTSVCAAALLSSCQEELTAEINDLSLRVSDIEAIVKNINNDVASLRTMAEVIEANVYISSVTQKKSGTTIVFSNNQSITIKNGTDGEVPDIGIIYMNGKSGFHYYWTVNGDPNFVDNGAITATQYRADAYSPIISINKKGEWCYDIGAGEVSTGVKATGESGSSFFKTIDFTSNPNAVIFTLANSMTFQIPTMASYEKLAGICSTVTKSLEGTRSVLTSIDSNIFVESITEVVENGVSLGYDVRFEGGKIINLRTGVNDTTSIYFSIAKDADSTYYWQFRKSDTLEYTWLLYKGEKIGASPIQDTPVVGVKDSLGVLYFTFSHNEGEPEFMRDANGELIQASDRIGFRFFQSFVEEGGNIVATLANGTKINLIKSGAVTPSLMLTPDRDTVSKGNSYTIEAEICDTLLIAEPCATFKAYLDSSDVRLTAIAIDNGYVSSIDTVDITAVDTLISGKQYAIKVKYNINFKTGSDSDFVVGRKSRIAAFMTFDSRQTMKTVEFTNVESVVPEEELEEEEPEEEEPEEELEEEL